MVTVDFGRIFWRGLMPARYSVTQRVCELPTLSRRLKRVVSFHSDRRRGIDRIDAPCHGVMQHWFHYHIASSRMVLQLGSFFVTLQEMERKRPRTRKCERVQVSFALLTTVDAIEIFKEPKHFVANGRVITASHASNTIISAKMLSSFSILTSTKSAARLSAKCHCLWQLETLSFGPSAAKACATW